jgi:hypothetical protein
MTQQIDLSVWRYGLTAIKISLHDWLNLLAAKSQEPYAVEAANWCFFRFLGHRNVNTSKDYPNAPTDL